MVPLRAGRGPAPLRAQPAGQRDETAHRARGDQGEAGGAPGVACRPFGSVWKTRWFSAPGGARVALLRPGLGGPADLAPDPRPGLPRPARPRPRPRAATRPLHCGTGTRARRGPDGSAGDREPAEAAGDPASTPRAAATPARLPGDSGRPEAQAYRAGGSCALHPPQCAPRLDAAVPALGGARRGSRSAAAVAAAAPELLSKVLQAPRPRPPLGRLRRRRARARPGAHLSGLPLGRARGPRAGPARPGLAREPEPPPCSTSAARGAGSDTAASPRRRSTRRAPSRTRARAAGTRGTAPPRGAVPLPHCLQPSRRRPATNSPAV